MWGYWAVTVAFRPSLRMGYQSGRGHDLLTESKDRVKASNRFARRKLHLLTRLSMRGLGMVARIRFPGNTTY